MEVCQYFFINIMQAKYDMHNGTNLGHLHENNKIIYKKWKTKAKNQTKLAINYVQKIWIFHHWLMDNRNLSRRIHRENWASELRGGEDTYNIQVQFVYKLIYFIDMQPLEGTEISDS